MLVSCEGFMCCDGDVVGGLEERQGKRTRGERGLVLDYH